MHTCGDIFFSVLFHKVTTMDRMGIIIVAAKNSACLGKSHRLLNVATEYASTVIAIEEDHIEHFIAQHRKDVSRISDQFENAIIQPGVRNISMELGQVVLPFSVRACDDSDIAAEPVYAKDDDSRIGLSHGDSRLSCASPHF